MIDSQMAEIFNFFNFGRRKKIEVWAKKNHKKQIDRKGRYL